MLFQYVKDGEGISPVIPFAYIGYAAFGCFLLLRDTDILGKRCIINSDARPDAPAWCMPPVDVRIEITEKLS